MSTMSEKNARILKALRDHYVKDGKSGTFTSPQAEIIADMAGIDVQTKCNSNGYGFAYLFRNSINDLHDRSFIRVVGYDYRSNQDIFEFTERGKEFIVLFDD